MHEKLAENVMKSPGKSLGIGAKTAVQPYFEIF